MADAPLIHPSGQPDYVNPQLDKTVTSPKQKAKLDANFDSFFKELDEKAANAPDPEPQVIAPANKEDDSPAKDDKPEEVAATPAPQPEVPEKKETAEEPAVPFAPTSILNPPPPSAPAGDAASAELEALELHPSASSEQKGQFAQLKEIAKRFKKQAEAYRGIAPLLKELGYTFDGESPEDVAKTLEDLAPKVRTWRTGAMSPEVSQELESLRQMARVTDYKRSREFIQEFVEPLQGAYVDVLDEAAKYFDAPEADVKTFLENMKANFRPTDLNEDWWYTQVIASMKKAPPDSPIRQKVVNKVAELLSLQEKHNKQLDNVAKNGDSYEKWQQQRNEQFSRDYDFQVRNEVETAFDSDKKHLKPWLPIPTKGVTDRDELAKIDAHNKRFSGLEKRFSDIMMGVNAGPRKAARYALDFIEMQERLPELEKSNTEKDAIVKALEAEVAKLKTEVTTKRKVSDVPLRNGSGTPGKTIPEKQKLTDTVGSKGLRAAFEKDLPGG